MLEQKENINKDQLNQVVTTSTREQKSVHGESKGLLSSTDAVNSKSLQEQKKLGRPFTYNPDFHPEELTALMERGYKDCDV